MKKKRRLRVVIGCVLACVGLAALGRCVLAPTATEADADSRLVLGRVWFDHYPKTRGEDVTIGIWLAGGIGLYDTGSAWRSTVDVFEFERRGSTLDMTFLHDKKKASPKFTIKRCDEQPPFDLCLDFDDAPRGPRRLYGFGDEGDAAAKVPWSRDLVRTAQARAGMAR